MKEGQTIFIGIIEETMRGTSFKFLKGLFMELGFEKHYNNKNTLAILNRDKENIIIIDINYKTLSAIENLGIDFNIVIHTFVKDYNSNVLKEIVSKTQYLIVNCDEEKWTSLLDDNIETIVISYGFNNKATINPSSFNKQDLLESSICLQRQIQTIDKDIIEPFELPIKLSSKKKLDIYPAIGTIACGLVLNIDISEVDFLKIYNKINS